VVTRDINTAPGSTRTAGVLPASQPRPPFTTLAGLALLPPILGLLLCPSRRPWRYGTGVLLLILCCGLAVTSCSGGGGDNNKIPAPFTFTVGLPASGVNGQGAISGQLSGPAAALPGPTVTVIP